jgi:hypothetical protein
MALLPANRMSPVKRTRSFGDETTTSSVASSTGSPHAGARCDRSGQARLREYFITDSTCACGLDATRLGS